MRPGYQVEPETVGTGLPEAARAHASRTITFEAADRAPDALRTDLPAIDPENPPIAAIRDLLEAAFTVQTLRRFCQDRPPFRPLLNEFSPDHGLADMVERAIDYCGKSVLWDELLAGVQEVNPRQCARFVERLQ